MEAFLHLPCVKNCVFLRIRRSKAITNFEELQ